MKKFITVMALAVLLTLPCMSVSAYTTPSGGATPPSSSSGGNAGGPGTPAGGSTGSASGTVDPETGEVDVDIEFPFNVYTPKVTYIKSVNAALANYDGIPVYYMPKLEDFPTDLEDVVADLTDSSGVRHQFAAVYTGYFDTDVVYAAAAAGDSNNSKLQTSKKVYSSEDNSRLLNLLGYDLLLSQEKFDIKVEDGNISMGYNPTRIPTNQLRADTCIMDLYKAMGVYEYDIEFAFGVDKNLDVEKSPILQMIPVLTSGEKNKGYDTSESVVWVAATRTNPDQYWNRCLQDAIFDGGLHNLTAPSGSFVGSETSVSFSLGKGEQVSLGEFCALARAIMTLYGEPVMTPAEQERCLLAYGVTVPANSFTKEIRDSIIYLAAKGIIDPSEKNFNQDVTFADIEDILLRIADESARLTVKTDNISLLAEQGFSSLSRVAISDGSTSLEITDAEDLQYRDFLVEVCNDTIFYVTQSRQGYVAQSTSKPTAQYTPLVRQAENVVATGEKAQSTENIALLRDGKPVPQGNGEWKNAGIEEYTDIGGKKRAFYHFKINTDRFDEIHFVSSDTYEEGTGTEFTLENSDGGIYYYENGWRYEKFADYAFDDTYRDVESNSFVNSVLPLASSKQFAGLYVDSTTLNNARNLSTYDVGNGYHWDNIYTQSGDVKTNERIVVDESIYVCLIPGTSSSGTDYFRMELYGTNLNRVMQTVYMTYILNGEVVREDSNIGFYRAEDNTLLVSTGYLYNSKRITSFDDSLGNNVYVMGVKSVLGGRTSVDTNVVIYDDDSAGFIMVGDTMYPRRDGEIFIEQVGKDYYVNAKALTGWASDLVLVPNGNNSCAVAVDATLMNRSRNIYEDTDYVKTTGGTISVRTIPGGTENVLATIRDVAFNSTSSPRNRLNFRGSGVLLTSAYSLSNYCIVMADDSNTDYLFVYHIRGLEGSKGENGDAEAREMFHKLTNWQLSDDPNYYLKMYKLDRTEYGDVFGGSQRSYPYIRSGQEPMHYIQQTLHGSSFGEQTVTWGWSYSPVQVTNILDAAKEYAAGDSEQFKLPFVYYKGSYYDININVCKSSETAGDFEPIGTLPSYMFGKVGKQIGKLDSNLNATHSNPPSGNVFSDYKITAAPVGNFALFKASADSTIGAISTSNLYWGTTHISYDSRSGKVRVGRAEINLDKDTPVIRTYMGSSMNSVYVVQTSESNVAKLVEKTSDLIDSLIGRDAESLVDWDKYTFNRLIENLDSWSSIILIFILNILPRVCILLFFVLMLLALIKDVRPWKAFCNSTFDIYKFLTFGHQSVETIDLKRTIITSIICLALFYMIMDGALFNFIMWISEWFLVLMQK